MELIWLCRGWVDNMPLTNAILSYSNEEGDLVEVKTDSAGAFYRSFTLWIKSFTISYTYKEKKIRLFMAQDDSYLALLQSQILWKVLWLTEPVL